MLDGITGDAAGGPLVHGFGGDRSGAHNGDAVAG
jgi:hypothetical protein